MNERTMILETLQSAFETVLGARAGRLQEGMTLKDRQVDSLDLIEVMIIVEETHQIVLDGDDLQGLESVRELVDLVAAKRAATTLA